MTVPCPIFDACSAQRSAIVLAARSRPAPMRCSPSSSARCRGLEAALTIQRRVRAPSLPDGIAVQIRIGLHTGRTTLTDTGYIGLAVHTASRICFASPRRPDPSVRRGRGGRSPDLSQPGSGFRDLGPASVPRIARTGGAFPGRGRRTCRPNSPARERSANDLHPSLQRSWPGGGSKGSTAIFAGASPRCASTYRAISPPVLMRRSSSRVDPRSW